MALVQIGGLTIRDLNKFREDFPDDIRLGVMFAPDKEYYILVHKGENGAYTKIFEQYSCEFGCAVGDLIGTAKETPYVQSYDEALDTVKGCIEHLDYAKEPNSGYGEFEVINNICKSFHGVFTFAFNDIFTPENAPNRNLMFLPLYLEIFNGLKRDGLQYDTDNARNMLEEIKKYHKLFKTFAEKIMLFDKGDIPFNKYLSAKPSEVPPITYNGTSTILVFPLDNENKDTIKDFKYNLFIPDSLDDLAGYLVNKYVCNGYHFQLCPNCKRYFAFTTNSKTKYCRRPIEDSDFESDISKVCQDIGKYRTKARQIKYNSAVKLYTKYYKSANYKKGVGKVNPDTFEEWSRQARTQRDLCVNGLISYEELEQWFATHKIK